jgi:hypothetical protein
MRGTPIGYWKEIQRERPRRRWVDNIKMGLGETGWDDLD